MKVWSSYFAGLLILLVLLYPLKTASGQTIGFSGADLLQGLFAHDTPEEGVAIPLKFEFDDGTTNPNLDSFSTRIIGSREELQKLYLDIFDRYGDRGQILEVAEEDSKYIDYGREVFVFIVTQPRSLCTTPEVKEVRRIREDVIQVTLKDDIADLNNASCDSNNPDDSRTENNPSLSMAHRIYTAVIPRPVKEVKIQYRREDLSETRAQIKNLMQEIKKDPLE